jgi:hypothetical protein
MLGDYVRRAARAEFVCAVLLDQLPVAEHIGGAGNQANLTAWPREERELLTRAVTGAQRRG